jgi:SAM-dependent methyltransferase
MVTLKKRLKALAVELLDRINLLALANTVYNTIKYLSNPRLVYHNYLIRRKGGPDGLPLPSPQLIFLVSGQYGVESFYHNGLLGAQCIEQILEKNGLHIKQFSCILDFGCGCGRVIRHWHRLAGPKLYGVDYNPVSIDWCRDALRFADFRTNDLDRGLDFKDETFDFVYAISVLTHLTEELQNFWLGELRRILKPGGVLLLTTAGRTRLHQLSPEEQARFESGQLVVRYQKYEGTNVCGTFHPEPYFRPILAQRFTMIDYIEGGAKDANQDVFLVRKNG